MFIENYKLYLTKCGYSESTIKIYSKKLQYFLENGFSVDDLIGSVDSLIADYSKGGVSYSADKHGNTRNALKRLNDFLLRDYIDTLYIKYEISKIVFAPTSIHIIEYIINKNTITIKYNSGKIKVKRIDDNDYYALLKFLDANKHRLRESDLLLNPPLLTDTYTEKYEYTFGTYNACGCNDLFESSTPEQTRIKYKALIDKICS